MEERLKQLEARKQVIEMELGEINLLIKAYEDAIKAEAEKKDEKE
jgi:hypothetical protein